MEIARLEARYVADITDLERKSTQADSRLKQTATQAKQTEKQVSRSFTTTGSASRTLSRDIGLLGQSLNALSPRAGQAVSSFSSMSTEAAAMGGALGLAAGGATILAAALGAVVAGLYKLVIASAETTGHLFDLSRQTSFSVETLSALQNAAETSGGSLQTVTGALGIFEKNMEAAHDAGNELSQVFKVLKIDIDDNEKALRQAFIALSKMPEGAQQTAIAMKLFGRSGKDMLGILKEMGGDVDAFIKQLRDMGLLITTDAAVRGDVLSDSLTRLSQQFHATGRVVADEFAPDVQRTLVNLERILRDNKDTARAWGQALAEAMRGIAALANSELGTLVGWIVRLEGAMGGLPAVFSLLRSAGGPGQRSLPSPYPGYGILTDKGRRDAAFEQLATSAITSAPRMNFGGGGGGAGRRTRTAADPSVGLMVRLSEELQKLADSYDDVDTSTRSYAISQEIANGALKKASPDVQNHARLIGQQVDMLTRAMKINDQVTAFQKTQSEQVRLAIEGERDHIEVVAEFIKALETEDTKIDETVKHWLHFNATVLQFSEDMERLNDILNNMPDNIGVFSVPEFDPNVIGQRLEDLFGPPPAARSEERMRQMQDVAAEIGFVFGDLFDSIGRGWEDLWQNMLNIARNIGNRIVSDIFTGLLEGLFNVPMGQRSGGISGLISGRIQGRADGGPVSAGQLYRINERGQEFFRPSGSGEVIPLGGQSGNSRFIFVDDERAAQERRSASDRNYIIRMRRMRKVGKLVPAL